jgi:hypothetical protein
MLELTQSFLIYDSKEETYSEYPFKPVFPVNPVGTTLKGERSVA